MTPEDAECAQDKLLALWLMRRCPRGTKRRTDRSCAVKVYDLMGQSIGTDRQRHAPRITTWAEDRRAG